VPASKDTHNQAGARTGAERLPSHGDAVGRSKVECQPANLRRWRSVLLLFLLLDWFLLPARLGWLWSKPYWETTALVILVFFGDACFAVDIYVRYQVRRREWQSRMHPEIQNFGDGCIQKMANCVDVAACTLLYLSAFIPSPAGDWVYFVALVPRLARCSVLLDELHRQASQIERRTAVLLRLLFVITSSTQWAGAAWFMSARLAGFAEGTWLHQLATDGVVVDSSLVEELSPEFATASNGSAIDANQEMLMAALFFGVSSLTTVGYSGVSPGSLAEVPCRQSTAVCPRVLLTNFLRASGIDQCRDGIC
jgi:hypothetical protein